jgi:hypothetical protein
MKWITLTQGKRTCVNDDVYARVGLFKWTLNRCRNNQYAYRKVNGRNVYLHREVLGVPGNLVIDHIDGNGLNNLRENLRGVGVAENCRGFKRARKHKSSKYLGVLWYGPRNKWVAYIKCDYKNKHLGYFVQEMDAARARDGAAKRLFGKHATLNFPE